MNKVLLGISCGYHDSAAALVAFTGEVLFASSEERFTRIKGDSSYPVNSINHAVDLASKNNLVISKICIHENYFLRKTGFVRHLALRAS